MNEAFRFGRREIGASVTGSGRQITKHMGETIAKVITGKKWEFEKRYAGTSTAGSGSDYVVGYEYAQALKQKNFIWLRSLPDKPYQLIKKSADGQPLISGAVWFTECEDIIYGDTDSCYFLTNGTDYESAVFAADEIAAQTNDSFPAFMRHAFNCAGGREKLIKAAREIVAERGLFLLAKKKYTLKVVNLDGKDLRAKPKQKSMGSEIKKADTPKIVQEFLKGMMELMLDGAEYSALESFVNSYRGKLINGSTNLLELAPAKQVNNLDAKYAEYKRTEKVGNGKMGHCPGHVRAAINYNELREALDPEGPLKPLKAGDKAAILYLKKNDMKLKSIGFPSDLMHLPTWFTDNFSVDLKLTEEKMIDAKIERIFEAIDQPTPTPQYAFLKSVFTL